MVIYLSRSKYIICWVQGVKYSSMHVTQDCTTGRAMTTHTSCNARQAKSPLPRAWVKQLCIVMPLTSQSSLAMLTSNNAIVEKIFSKIYDEMLINYYYYHERLSLSVYKYNSWSFLVRMSFFLSSHLLF